MIPKPVPISLAVGRLFFVLGTIFLLFLVAYVGVAAYYATKVNPAGGTHTQLAVVGGNQLALASSVNLSDPGPFAISGLTVTAHLAHPDSTPWLSTASTPIDLAGGGTGTLVVRLLIPVADLVSSATLLFNDSNLPYNLTLNATYASLVSISIRSAGVYHWGAPFYHLNSTFGTPSRQPNGSVVIPVTVSFTNHAPIDLAGSLTVTFRDPSGAGCGTLIYPIQAAAGANFRQTTNVDLPAGCASSGGSYSAVWAGSGLVIPLGGGRLP
jgi:hypothetical protein